LGGAEGETSISLKQTEFSLKLFAKSSGQPNCSASNKWKKVWVGWVFGEKASELNLRSEIFETSLRWPLALGDSNC